MGLRPTASRDAQYDIFGRTGPGRSGPRRTPRPGRTTARGCGVPVAVLEGRAAATGRPAGTTPTTGESQPGTTARPCPSSSPPWSSCASGARTPTPVGRLGGRNDARQFSTWASGAEARMRCALAPAGFQPRGRDPLNRPCCGNPRQVVPTGRLRGSVHVSRRGDGGVYFPHQDLCAVGAGGDALALRAGDTDRVAGGQRARMPRPAPTMAGQRAAEASLRRPRVMSVDARAQSRGLAGRARGRDDTRVRRGRGGAGRPAAPRGRGRREGSGTAPAARPPRTGRCSGSRDRRVRRHSSSAGSWRVGRRPGTAGT